MHNTEHNHESPTEHPVALPTQSLTVAAVQMTSSHDVAHNLLTAEHWVRMAAEQGAKLVVLPEYFCLFGHKDTDKLNIAEPFNPLVHQAQHALPESTLQTWASGLAKCLGVYLLAGTMPLQSPQNNRVYNASLLYNDVGEIHARYDKIHLFEFANQGERYCETDTLLPGKQSVVADVFGWKFGLSICYDLRFPELYRNMLNVGLHCILMPAAFTATTGQAHWEVLLRARAIENQCYVLASAQSGLHSNGRRTHGQSMLVNPWGEIDHQLDPKQHEGAGLIVAKLKPTQLARVRRALPALSSRVL